MPPAWMEKIVTRVDATSDPRLSSGERPVMELHYNAVPDGHRRVVAMAGEAMPRWQVTRQSVLGAWGSKCVVTRTTRSEKESGTGAGDEAALAVIDFHIFTTKPYIEIERAEQEEGLKLYNDEQEFDASGYTGGSLCTLRRKNTGGAMAGAGSWEMRESTAPPGDGLVMSVSLEGGQKHGVIRIWRAGLDASAAELLVLVAVAQIEYSKYLARVNKRSKIMKALG
ncbi:hypothetical protein MN608_02921 [Microdochium nivale]|nr:hypothetical protein MN608_02921 [Microdochium nivale]